MGRPVPGAGLTSPGSGCARLSGGSRPSTRAADGRQVARQRGSRVGTHGTSIGAGPVPADRRDPRLPWRRSGSLSAAARLRSCDAAGMPLRRRGDLARRHPERRVASARATSRALRGPRRGGAAGPARGVPSPARGRRHRHRGRARRRPVGRGWRRRRTAGSTASTRAFRPPSGAPTWCAFPNKITLFRIPLEIGLPRPRRAGRRGPPHGHPRAGPPRRHQRRAPPRARLRLSSDAAAQRRPRPASGRLRAPTYLRACANDENMAA